MAPFGWDNDPEGSGFFEGGVATVTEAHFEEAEFGIQLVLKGVNDEIEDEFTIGFYSLGKGERSVADGGKRVIGDNFKSNSKAGYLMQAWKESGAPAPHGDTADALVGYTFEWENKDLYEVQGRTYGAMLPVKYIGTEGRASDVELAEAFNAQLTEKGPQKLYQLIMGMPEGDLREAATVNGSAVIAQMVKDGLVTQEGDVYTVVS